MKSKAILEQGFSQIRQAQCGTVAQNITTDIYSKLLDDLIEMVGDERKTELAKKLTQTLANAESDLNLELPLKMKKRDTKILKKR